MDSENNIRATETGPSASPRHLKRYVGAIIILIVSFTAVGYAATQLAVSNSGTVVLATKNIQGITFSPPSAQPTCSSATPYSDTPSAIAWGNIAQGGSANGYICVKNLGGSGTTYVVTTSVAPPTGITVTYNGTATLTSAALQNGQTSLINVVVSVALSTLPAGFSYTTSIA